MIFFDTTKSGAAAHRSGLVRVAERLLDELGSEASPVRWSDWDRRAGSADWFLTAELFSETERPGIGAFLDRPPCRTAAIFHDAIPLKHPHITWPQSVARHPGYLKLLAKFHRVWAVSAASRDELLGFWRWQGVASAPPVDVLPLGADLAGVPRVAGRRIASRATPSLLCVGILEPRKNQGFLLDVCESLWRDGVAFDLDLVGRVNPHFGKPIAARAKALARKWPVRLRSGIGDRDLVALYANARASVFPTIAEGCGLPLLESLWLGVPCIASELPVLRENAEGGGCVAVPVGDATAWAHALRRILQDDAWAAQLTQEAAARPLPTWRSAADRLRAGLR